MSIKDIKEKSKPTFDWIRDRGLGLKNTIKNKLSLVSDTHFKSDTFIVLAIILVGLIGFGLGRLSAFETPSQALEIKKLICPINPISNSDISVNSSSEIVGNIDTQKTGQGMLVASKNGTKYYFPWCSGVSRISEANKVWYNSYDEAKATGKTPASGCLGLK